MLVDQCEQLGVELVGLVEQEADADGDGAQCEHGDSVLDAGADGAGEGLDAVELRE